MIYFFVLSLMVQGIALSLPAILRNERHLRFIVPLLNAGGFICGLIFSLTSLLNYHYWEIRWTLPFAGSIPVVFNGLTLFFLFTFQLLFLATSIYAVDDLKYYSQRGDRLHGHLTFFTIWMLSMQFLLVVHHALVFLIFWEMMAIAAYFCIVLEKEKPEVRRGGFWYLVATHVSVLFLYVFFLGLHRATGSWAFADFARHTMYERSAMIPLLAAGFLGFGIKAGFMPFHVWLPNAHSVAPTHISGLLSAINIKAGIYGMALMFTILPAGYVEFGWGLLAFSLISAIGGVWHALAQHHIKKLLAYHSVENIGIIGLGLAVAWIGRCVGSPTLVFMGLVGALLHTLNHAIFKALLFFGAGNVDHQTHTSNIEKMGGLFKVFPVTGIGFLIGAISICGLPPFNGFLSEFLIYRSFFQASNWLSGYAPLILLISVASLAFMGGLAVACFTKLYGVVFLGENRSGEVMHPVPENMPSKLSLLGLATLCGWIGLFPGKILKLLLPALSEISTVSKEQIEANLISPFVGTWIWVFVLFFGIVLVTFLLKGCACRKFGVRVNETWSCGYSQKTPRMQYTASSFVEELVKLGHPWLGLKLHWNPLKKIFPGPRSFESHPYDPIEKHFWLTLYRKLGLVFEWFKWIQSGNIRHYVLYIFAALIFYLLVAFLW